MGKGAFGVSPQRYIISRAIKASAHPSEGDKEERAREEKRRPIIIIEKKTRVGGSVRSRKRRDLPNGKGRGGNNKGIFVGSRYIGQDMHGRFPV